MLEDIFWPSASYLAEWLGVHISTARRYVREQNAPQPIVMLVSRDLGIWDADWRGWTIVEGKLRSPEGITMTAAEALSHPFMLLQIGTLQADNRKLRKELDAGIEDQPSPAEWDLARVLAG